LPVSHRGGPGLILGHSNRELWWTKWDKDSVLLSNSVFLSSLQL